MSSELIRIAVSIAASAARLLDGVADAVTRFEYRSLVR
jgi:hypothetical protein